ncbi:MAG: hypothetical protein SFW67_30785 [Myxococcaceae bacterium]|nr:hypothetical protein [Myxococcaceae bacterium]
MRWLLLFALLPSVALARPSAPALLCQTYPTAPACVGGQPTCLLCHSAPPALNLYGAAVAGQGLGASFDTALPGALRAVEALDSDEDGQSNGDELRRGTLPGDAASVAAPVSAQAGANPSFSPGQWDARFAFTRVKAAFCGVSPTYEERKALAAATDPKAFVHQALDACLRSTHWRDEALPRLADARIKPLGSAGTCLNFYGNFEPDYFLFIWALTDGRDARQLLRAQHHVQRNADGSLSPIDVTRPILPPVSRAGVVCRDRYGNTPSKVGGQPLQVNKRAGLLTTQWFLWRNTMGALMPRGTAALAASSWLGTEYSLYEGLHPVPNEPRDLDAKNVAVAPCNQCHSTLDPLAYAFSSYWGGTGSQRPEFTGVFQVDRHLYLTDLSMAARDEWSRNPPRAHLFGQPLPLDREVPQSSALVELGKRMSDSEPFARTLVEMVWVHAVGAPPGAAEQAEFEALWKGLPAMGFSLDRVLHALVDTNALGAP